MTDVKIYQSDLSVVLFLMNPLKSFSNLTLSVFKCQEICFEVFIVNKYFFLSNLTLWVIFHHQTGIKYFDVLCSDLKLIRK